MAYISTNWQTGDIVTAEKLNHLEKGHLPEFDQTPDAMANSVSLQFVEQPDSVALAGPFNFSIPAGESEYMQEIELDTELQADNTYFISLNGVLHKAEIQSSGNMIAVQYIKEPIGVAFMLDGGDSGHAPLLYVQSTEDSGFEGSVALYSAAQYELDWKIDPYPEYDIVIGCGNYINEAVKQDFYFIKDNGFLNMKIEEGIPIRGALFFFPTSESQHYFSMNGISHIYGTEDEYNATFSSPYLYSETDVKLQIAVLAFKSTGLPESDIIKNFLFKTVDIGTVEEDEGGGVTPK